MPVRKYPGLFRGPGGEWRLDKRVRGIGRIQRRGPPGDVETGNAWAEAVVAEVKREAAASRAPEVTFRRAATRYLEENQHKRSIDRDAQSLVLVDPYIGALKLRQVHAGTVQPFIDARRRTGVKSATVRRDLAIVRRVLTLAARLWRDDQTGEPWLATAPMLPAPNWNDEREPRPITMDEQRRLIAELPAHLARAALFMVNTGLRDGELRALRWSWLVAVPELGREAFVLPKSITKTRRERIVAPNRIARSVLEQCNRPAPGDDQDFPVFTYRGRAIRTPLDNTSWQKARARADLVDVRIHDLRHTFGRRLRAVGVSRETRAALLGHSVRDVTTHYSAAELAELFDAVEQIADLGPSGSTLSVLRAVD